MSLSGTSSGNPSTVPTIDQMEQVVDISKLKKGFTKENLVDYILHLRNKVEELASYRLISARVEKLERSHFKSLQYSRRESIEISGIPENVNDRDLEKKTVDILDKIGVSNINPINVHACHRLKNKNTIIRFTNRRIADFALYKRGKLKSVDKKAFGFPADTRLFINESLCQPYKYIFFKIREAYKKKKITSYNLWKGKLSFKFNKDSTAIIISHFNDLVENGLADDSDMDSYLKSV